MFQIFKVQTGRRQELSDALTNKNNPGNSVTAAIRSRLNKSHTFEFIEGDWHTSPAPGMIDNLSQETASVIVHF